jgi:hypothetical protein
LGEGCEECIDKESRIELLQQELRALRPIVLQKLDQRISRIDGAVAEPTTPELDILQVVSIKHHLHQRRISMRDSGDKAVNITTHESPATAHR